MPAPTVTHLLQDESNVDATSYVTASLTVTAGKPVLFAVFSARTTGTGNLPTLSVLPAGVTLVAGSGTGAWTRNTVATNRATIFLLTGSGADTVTIDFAGQTQHGIQWTVAEVNDMPATLPTNVVGANGTSATPSVDFGTLTAGNSAYSFCIVDGQVTHTADAGWTLTAVRQDQATPSMSSSAQSRANHDDTTSSLVLGSSQVWEMIGVELPAVVVATSKSGWGIVS